MSGKYPTLSVVMCTYNGAMYIEEQLNSIVEQTYPIHELIIQDDGSTDNTVEIIQHFCSRYKFIHLFRNAQQLGINRNFFSAMERATGEFIAISDQDDIWEKDKLETQMNLIGDKLLCSGLSKPFSSDPTVKFSFEQRIPNFSLSRFMFAFPLAGHTLLFRKNLLSLIPNLPGIISLFMYDVILGVTAATQNSIVYADKILVHFRRHPSAATYTSPSDYKRTPGNMIQIVFRTYKLSQELKPIMTERLQNISYFLKSFPEQNRNIQKALKLANTLISDSYLRQAFICIQMRNEIFYTRERNPFIAILRAIYFPIYCYEYIKRFSRLNKNQHQPA